MRLKDNDLRDPVDSHEIDTADLLQRIGQLCPPRTSLSDFIRKVQQAVREFRSEMVPDEKESGLLVDIEESWMDPSFYMEALRNASRGVMAIDGEGRILYLNKAAENAFGYSEKEIIGTEFQNLLDVDHDIALIRQLQGFRESGQISSMVTLPPGEEILAVRKDGTNFPAEISLARANDLVVATIRDISSERILLTILENIPGGVTLFDANLQMIACNEELKRLLGFPDWLFEGGYPTLEELARFNAERGDYGDGNIDEIVEGVVERAKRFEAHTMERTRPDGTVLEIRGVPLPNGGFVTIYTDITERKIAEEKLRNAIKETERAREHLQSVIEHLPQGVTVIDKDLNVITWNSSFVQILDLPCELMKPGVTFEDIARFNAERGDYGEGDPEIQREKRIALAKRFERHRFERTVKSGRIIEVRGAPIKGGGFITTYTDITEVRKSGEKLRETVQLMNEIIRNSSMFVWELDPKGRFVFVQGSERSLGYTPKEMLGREFEELLPSDSVPALNIRHPFSNVVVSLAAKGGREVWMSLTGLPVYSSKGRFAGCRGVSVDVTEKHLKDMKIQELFKKLEEAALHDNLTGLANRKKFNERFDVEVKRQRRNGRPFSLLVADLDHFKAVNDTFGHLVGDEVLKKIAETLQREMRATDLVARFGGEEFIVLLPETDRLDARRVAEKVRARVAGRELSIQGADRPLHVTLSIGVSTMLKEDQRSFDDLMEAADRAVYQAKQDGRNRVAVYEEALPRK